jgi:hypothetical protein
MAIKTICSMVAMAQVQINSTSMNFILSMFSRSMFIAEVSPCHFFVLLLHPNMEDFAINFIALSLFDRSLSVPIVQLATFLQVSIDVGESFFQRICGVTVILADSASTFSFLLFLQAVFAHLLTVEKLFFFLFEVAPSLCFFQLPKYNSFAFIRAIAEKQLRRMKRNRHLFSSVTSPMSVRFDSSLLHRSDSASFLFCFRFHPPFLLRLQLPNQPRDLVLDCTND